MQSSDKRIRHREISERCQLCGDQSTTIYKTVSGLSRHCIATHGCLYYSDGRYARIPQAEKQRYQEKIQKWRCHKRRSPDGIPSITYLRGRMTDKHGGIQRGITFTTCPSDGIQPTLYQHGGITHATCLHGRIPHNSRDDRSRQQKSIKQRKGGSNCDDNQHAIKWEQYDSTDDDEDGDEQQPCSNRKLAQLKWERY